VSLCVRECFAEGSAASVDFSALEFELSPKTRGSDAPASSKWPKALLVRPKRSSMWKQRIASEVAASF
jgi:hypothetical protein